MDAQLKLYQQKMSQYPSLKAMQILTALILAKKELSVTEISKITGIPLSTVHRVLAEMVECGIAGKAAEERGYGVGIEARAVALTLSESDFLYHAAREEMVRLSELSQETIHLIVEANQEATYLAIIGTKNVVGLHSVPGKHIPLYCTGGGKCIMAWHDEEWIAAYYRSHQVERFTPNTITTEREFIEEAKKIRQRGYALDNKEHHSDVVCVAAPIFNGYGKLVGTISVGAPEYRFPLEMAAAFAPEVVKSAKAVTEKIHGASPAQQ